MKGGESILNLTAGLIDTSVTTIVGMVKCRIYEGVLWLSFFFSLKSRVYGGVLWFCFFLSKFDVGMATMTRN